MRFFLSLLAMTCAAHSLHAGVYDCQGDAMMRAGKLLKLHWDAVELKLADLPGEPATDGTTMA